MSRGLTSIFFIVLFLVLSSFAFAHTDKFGKPDTIRITVFQDDSSKQVQVKVFLYNDEEIAAITVPIKFGEAGEEPDLDLDSVIFRGTRVDYFQWQSAWLDSAENKIKIGLISAISSQVPMLKPGSGDIATMFFTIKENAKAEKIVLDTCTARPSVTLEMVHEDKKLKLHTFTPVFDNTKGKIIISQEEEKEEKVKKEK